MPSSTASGPLRGARLASNGLHGIAKSYPKRRREDEEAVGREVMRRLTDEELERYDRALERALEEGFAEEDRTILERVQRLYEEVHREFTGAQA